MNIRWLSIATALCPACACASQGATGSFNASRTCDAYLSFNKKTNPGAVHVSPGETYEIREVNDAQRDWYRVEISGIREPLRWVASTCGTAAGDASAGGSAGTSSAPAPPQGGGQCHVAGRQDSYVLAMSWQPGFCEHVRYSGDKPECDHMADGSLVVSNLTLHGLWPNRSQCGTHYDTCGGPALHLDADTLSYVKPWMPNFNYQTTFGNYEWTKHGTCSGMQDNVFFRRAVDSVKVVNDSQAGQYLRANIGGAISQKTFFDRIESDAGAAARNSIALVCTGRYLTEIHVHLPLDFKEGATLKQLLGAAPQAQGDASCHGDQILIEASGR